MKSYEENFDYEAVRDFVHKHPKIIIPVFYEELVWLVNNEGFQREIQKLREKWKLYKPIQKPHVETGEYWGKVILENIELSTDALAIAKCCRIYREKHRLPLIEAIISFALYDSFTTYIADARFLLKKDTPPISHLEINNIDGQISLTLSCSSETKLKDVIIEIRNKWKELKKADKAEKRLNPSFNVFRDYLLLYRPHAKGVKVSTLNKFYRLGTEDNNVAKTIKRVSHRIEQSFKGN